MNPRCYSICTINFVHKQPCFNKIHSLYALRQDHSRTVPQLYPEFYRKELKELPWPAEVFNKKITAVGIGLVDIPVKIVVHIQAGTGCPADAEIIAGHADFKTIFNFTDKFIKGL